MFTGIIEATGRVRDFRNGLLKIEVPRRFLAAKKGASIAVNGACLTVVARDSSALSFQVVKETMRRTAFGRLKIGDRVNLERPLKYGDRVDGHFVLGHVDAVGHVKKVVVEKKWRSLFIVPPASFLRHVVEKGSVAVDGVSLAIGKVNNKGFWLHLIPHTLKKTSLSHYKLNSYVNLEGDVLTKWALRKRAGKSLR